MLLKPYMLYRPIVDNKIIKFLLLIFISIFASQTESHSGGLNSQGCHSGSQPYHCHRSSSDMIKSSYGGYRLKCSLGSQSKDCLNQDTTSKSKDTNAYLNKTLDL